MKKSLICKILIVLVAFLVWVYFYPKLPDIVPIHWWFDGIPDRTGSKTLHIFLFPLLITVMLLVFSFLPKLDPKKENYEKFWTVWEIFQFSIVWFFLYIYIVSNFVILYPEYNISRFMMFGIGILFIILGNYMGKLRQNYFVWIKLPWTLADEQVWNKTHRFWGKMFLLWGLLFLFNAFFLWQTAWIFMLALCSVLFAPIIYSYIIFKKKKTS